MKLYKYEDDAKIATYPLLYAYIEMVKESWEARVFGITMPLFLIAHTIILITFPLETFNWTALILQGAASLWFIISYSLLIRKQMKDTENELKRAIYKDYQKSF